MQRYTESYVMFQRAYNIGAFAPLLQRLRRRKHNEVPTVRVVSIGGGPGYELMAFQDFLGHLTAGGVYVDAISLDCVDDWYYVCKQLSTIRFGLWDLFNDPLSVQDVLLHLELLRVDQNRVFHPFVRYPRLCDSFSQPSHVHSISPLHVDFYIFSYIFHQYIVHSDEVNAVVKLLHTSPVLSADASACVSDTPVPPSNQDLMQGWQLSTYFFNEVDCARDPKSKSSSAVVQLQGYCPELRHVSS
uniref:Uncharacterized protein n=1 Tax=Lygus hesperus TaxID=30085 RepID=A0A146MGV9_LYGHE